MVDNQKSEALEAFTTPIYSKKAQPTPLNKDLFLTKELSETLDSI